MVVHSGFLSRCVLVFALAAAGLRPASAQTDAASRREAIEAIYPVMIAALQDKNFGRARNICDQAILWEPQNPVHHYNLACIEAQAGGSRLPYAISELELAVALGFDDATHLQADPDLTPLHSDPKFSALVRKITFNAAAGSAVSSLVIPPAKSAGTSDPAGSTGADSAAPLPSVESGFKDGAPVGLFFMTRYWAATRTLEKSAWYFAPDGRVYQQVERGASTSDLAAHRGPQGTYSIDGRLLQVVWSDGKKTVSELERDGSSFVWDMGIFTPVRAFDDPAELVGLFEGGESAASPSGVAAASRQLELRDDRTFTWTGVASLQSSGASSTVGSGAASARSGRWELAGQTLRLRANDGSVTESLVFPVDEKKNSVRAERFFFGGLIYKRQR